MHYLVITKTKNHNDLLLLILQIVNCSKFFFQPDKGRKNIEKQQAILNIKCKNIESLQDMIDRCRGLVKHEDVIKRCKIIESLENNEFNIHLIDYGSTIKVGIKDLFTINDKDPQFSKTYMEYVFELPIQCIECRLSEIIPSPIKCSSGWSEKSTEEFKKFILNKGLEISVNSFVDRIASVRLNVFPAAPETGACLNDHLVIMGYAQTSDDNYFCQIDKRRRQKELDRYGRRDASQSGSIALEDELADFTIAQPPELHLNEEIKLNGPHSPLECGVESIGRDPASGINIEASSVNNVLLDPFPNDGIKKILVAASMSRKDDRITLHNTTILPHLPGLTCLLGLMFSPMAEVRCRTKDPRYTSILTGLGCDENQKPHYGEHDCNINVDIELDQKDFQMINEMRTNMSAIMQTPTCFKFQARSAQKEREKKNARYDVCRLLLEIASRERRSLGIISACKNWNWNKNFQKIVRKEDKMYPNLPTVEQLKPLSEETKLSLKRRADELERSANINAKDQTLWCSLCEEAIETVIDLQLHVKKKLHKERLLSIRDDIMVG